MIDEKHELMFGWYPVVFLDVLGQRETLRQVRWPRSEEERSETFSLLKQTAGYVLHFRRFFQNYFENFAQPSGLLDSLSAEHREKIERIKSTSAEYRGFSDSFVASVALRNTDEHLTPATGLYSSLVAACARS